MRNSDSPTKRSVETFDTTACAILAICYRHAYCYGVSCPLQSVGVIKSAVWTSFAEKT